MSFPGRLAGKEQERPSEGDVELKTLADDGAATLTKLPRSQLIESTRRDGDNSLLQSVGVILLKLLLTQPTVSLSPVSLCYVEYSRDICTISELSSLEELHNLIPSLSGPKVEHFVLIPSLFDFWQYFPFALSN